MCKNCSCKNKRIPTKTFLKAVIEVLEDKECLEATEIKVLNKARKDLAELS